MSGYLLYPVRACARACVCVCVCVAGGTNWDKGTAWDDGSVLFLNLGNEYMSHTVTSLNYALKVRTFCYQ